MLRVLDPRAEFPCDVPAEARPLAPRVDSLRGKTVAILHHLSPAVGGKCSGSDPFMESLGSLLESRVAGVVWRLKPNHAQTGPRTLVDEVAAQADVVINGLCS